MLIYVLRVYCSLTEKSIEKLSLVNLIGQGQIFKMIFEENWPLFEYVSSVFFHEFAFLSIDKWRADKNWAHIYDKFLAAKVIGKLHQVLDELNVLIWRFYNFQSLLPTILPNKKDKYLGNGFDNLPDNITIWWGSSFTPITELNVEPVSLSSLSFNEFSFSFISLTSSSAVAFQLSELSELMFRFGLTMVIIGSNTDTGKFA